MFGREHLFALGAVIQAAVNRGTSRLIGVVASYVPLGALFFAVTVGAAAHLGFGVLAGISLWRARGGTDASDDRSSRLSTIGDGHRRTAMIDKPYMDIPGTTVFDADRARQGYWLNQFCMSLMHADNRDRFKRDERAYLDEWQMTEAQKQAVVARDMNRMISLGGNIYFLAKIGATDGLSFQQMAGSMTGMSEGEYRAMMVGGGRPIDGNRYTSEWED